MTMKYLLLLLPCLLLHCAGTVKTVETIPADTTVRWYRLDQFDIEGQGWKDTKEPYDRLPSKAEALVREKVFRLSQRSAGLCTRFITNASVIKATWTVKNEELAMPHFPATGVSGLDLYVKQEDGSWHWLGVGQPKQFPTNTVTLAKNIIGKKDREYLLYLPTYNQLVSLSIGLSKDAVVEKAPARALQEKPIVFYGTSITQGGCASRPGMPHVMQIGRQLNREVINLGFSGNGRMEPEVAQLLTELDHRLPSQPSTRPGDRAGGSLC
jgi:hypothetical protein